MHGNDDDDYQEAWEERAAIMQYCGGLPLAEAEYKARRCLDKEPPTQKEDKRSPEAREALTKARQILNGN